MKEKPNILFILSDDQGAWAMHCAGNQELYTPNLDRIAESGVRFDNFFCASPVCSPARASLLTGKIPSAHGVLDWLRSGNVDGEKYAAQGRENPYGRGYKQERKPIAYLEGQTAYTDILARNGYNCGLIGKWHLGDSVRPQHGFEKWYTLGLGGCCYYHPDIVENGTIHVEHGRYVTELFTDKALEYLEEQEKKEEPFYLSLHYTAPHDPWGREHHPEKWIDYYDSCVFASIPDVPDHPDLLTGPVYGTPQRKERLRGYFAAVSAMDEQIGRVLDLLEAKDMRKDTIIVFTADNGMSMGHHGVWGKGNATWPLNMYDSAVKVPFLVSWPGKVSGGRVEDAMVSGYDVFPTLLELAGMENPLKEELPGRSFAEYILECPEGVHQSLKGVPENDRECAKGVQKCPESSGIFASESKGKPSGGENTEQFVKDENGEQTQKKEDCRRIVIYDEYGPVRMIRDREWKYIHRYPHGRHELYHLTEDPGEERNLYGLPEYEEKVLMLRKEMAGWFQRYVDPAMDAAKEGVTGSGQLCRPGIYADRAEVYPPVGT